MCFHITNLRLTLNELIANMLFGRMGLKPLKLLRDIPDPLASANGKR